MSSDKTSHIIQSLAGNTAIVIAKGIAAVYTGSGALLAETLHSAADCGNQLLLLLGVKRSQRPPDPQHPLGHGRNLYFWSFMVALLLFSGGGVFSIYEGVHKLREPEPVVNAWVGLTILLFSLLIEGWATWGNLREMKRRGAGKSIIGYLRATKDSDLVVVFGENSAAVLGLLFAMASLLMAWKTSDGRWDAAGSLCIGAVLVGVAVFLAVETKSLLMGERADPLIESTVHEVVRGSAYVTELLNLITLQQGPNEVMVAMKVRMKSELSVRQACESINQLEVELKRRVPEVRWCFVEPDERP